MRHAGLEVLVGPLERHHVVHRHHHSRRADDRRAVDRERVVHCRPRPREVERQQRLLHELHGGLGKRWAAQEPLVRPVERAERAAAATPLAQDHELAVALARHLRERPQEAVRVAPDPLLAHVLDVERARVHADPHGCRCLCPRGCATDLPPRRRPRSARLPRAARCRSASRPRSRPSARARPPCPG